MAAPRRHVQFIVFPIRIDLHLEVQSQVSCNFQGSESDFGELRDSAGLVPIRNEDVPIGIDETAVGCAKDSCFDVVRIELVLRPLRLQGIVA